MTQKVGDAGKMLAATGDDKDNEEDEEEEEDNDVDEIPKSLRQPEKARGARASVLAEAWRLEPEDGLRPVGDREDRRAEGAADRVHEEELPLLRSGGEGVRHRARRHGCSGPKGILLKGILLRSG